MTVREWIVQALHFLITLLGAAVLFIGANMAAAVIWASIWKLVMGK